MAPRGTLRDAEEAALEGCNDESQESQQIMNALRAKYGIGFVSAVQSEEKSKSLPLLTKSCTSSAAAPLLKRMIC